MDQLINFFNQGWVGAIIGLIGIIYAYITFKISKIGTRLVYQWDSLKIISKGKKIPDEIEIIYKGKSVDRLYKTQIIVWNAGKKTIDGDDIVARDHLTMTFSENEEIINVNIPKVTREINNFNYSFSNKEKNKFNFHFGFLDPGDGAILEILHTDSNRYPLITGTIKGMPKGILNWSHNKGNTKSNEIINKGFSAFNKFMRFIINSMIGNIIFFILGLLFLGISFVYFDGDNYIYNIIGGSNLSSEERRLMIINWLVIGFLYSLIGGSYMWKKRVRIPKSLKNDSMEKF
ncbi:hypothetical protein ACQCT6_14100 [Cytobacillus gottheilii]|uniref:hypothetical protein n=1 Tax=Cytobacillus gottheilii TaxID=859144 RepID=UPI003CE81C03